jgi:para-nitrobenzyl esterase
MRARARLETRSGWLEGAVEDDGSGALRVFRGVPYARAPVGALRWAAPAPELPWAGVREALAFGPSAPQRPSVLMRMLGMDGAAHDEDCLALCVWTPARVEERPDGGRRPILVWLHGGAFTAGGCALPVYDGGALARRGDVVVVTVQYRLGALGWLALPEQLDVGEAGANFGLLDQIAALRWVREHAERLGGDPERVTVFGESAGAMSIGALLGAPAARGLFSRAILQSGAAHNVTPRAGAERIGALFRAALGEGAADLAALRALPVAAILDAQQRAADESWRHVEGLAFQPVCEEGAAGAVLPRPPLAALAAGHAAGVAVLAGTNLDEWNLFALADPKLASLDDEGLVRRVLRAPPRGVGDPEAFARRAIAVYRAARAARGAPAGARELWLALQSDRVFRIPAQRLLEAQRPHQPHCFAYLFTWPSPALDGRLGACHALEVPFVFGQLRDPRAAQLVGEGPAAQRLAERMMDAWLAFARDADPGWPAWDAAQRTTMVFGAECTVATDPLGAERAVWDEMP